MPKGEPSNFLTDAELQAKFTGLTAAVLGQERAEKLAEQLLTLDRANNIEGLLATATPPSAVHVHV